MLKYFFPLLRRYRSYSPEIRPIISKMQLSLTLTLILALIFPATPWNAPTSPQALRRSFVVLGASSSTSRDSAVLQLTSVLSRTVSASDVRHNSGLDGASTGWSDWVDPEMSKELQALLSSLRVNSASQLYKWLATSPSPVATADLNLGNTTDYVKGRVAVKLHVAASGQSLLSAEAAPPGKRRGPTLCLPPAAVSNSRSARRQARLLIQSV